MTDTVKAALEKLRNNPMGTSEAQRSAYLMALDHAETALAKLSEGVDVEALQRYTFYVQGGGERPPRAAKSQDGKWVKYEDVQGLLGKTVPDGYALVPIEPTDEMMDAYVENGDTFRKKYHAMIAAAPKPTDAQGEG